MSISRHNVATLRRTLGITASARGPDTLALAKCVCGIKEDCGHRMSHRRFSPGIWFGNPVSYVPCKTLALEYRSGGRELCKHAPSTSPQLSPDGLHPFWELCGTDCRSPPVQQTLRERLRDILCPWDTSKLLPTSVSSADGSLILAQLTAVFFRALGS